MQTSYDYAPAAAFAGMVADCDFSFFESMNAKEAIKPGLGLVKYKGRAGAVRLPQVNKATIVLSADLVSGDTITTVIQGRSIATTFATDHATTLAAHAAALAAVAGISSATAATRTITILASNNTVLTVSSSVASGGAGTAVATVTDLTQDSLYGIARHSHTLTPATYPGKTVFDKSTLVFDADLVASDVVGLTVNGVALTDTTYATSHAATMAVLKSKLLAAAGIISVTVSSRTLTILAPTGLSLDVVCDVTNGGSGTAQPTVTPSTQDQTLGVVQYPSESPVNVMRRGRIYVPVEEDVDTDDAVYVRFKTSGTKTPGGFRTDADSNTALLVSGANYVTAASAGGVAVVEINLP